MKKRMVSFLLALFMVVSLASTNCIPVAKAEDFQEMGESSVSSNDGEREAEEEEDQETVLKENTEEQDAEEQEKAVEEETEGHSEITNIAIDYDYEVPASEFTFEKDTHQYDVALMVGDPYKNCRFQLTFSHKKNSFLEVKRDGEAVEGFTNPTALDTSIDSIAINPFRSGIQDKSKTLAFTLTFTVGNKADSNNDGVIDADDEYISQETYTFHIAVVPKLTKLYVQDANGGSLLSLVTDSIDQYQKNFYFTSPTDQIIINGIQTTPTISAATIRPHVYVGNESIPDDKYIGDSNSVKIRLQDYTSDGENVAQIPIRLTVPETGVSREVNLCVTYKNPNIPQVSNIEQSVECDKFEKKELTAQATCENVGIITYQWNRWSIGLTANQKEPMEGMTGETFNIPTDWAGTYYYSCTVTNTVEIDGTSYQYSAETNMAKVTVRLSEVSKAVIQEQPGTFALTDKGKTFINEYKKDYTRGQSLDTIFLRLKMPEDGTKLSIAFFYSAKDTLEDALPLEGTSKLVSSTDKVYADYMESTEYVDYTFETSESLPDGEFYVYAVVTSTATENPEMTASTTSEAFPITITKAETTLKGSGTQEDPYQITSGEDLEWIREQVANGNPFSGVYFRFENDVTLPEGWQPIGCTKDGQANIDSGRNLNAFSGNINGAGYTLTVPEGGKPLLGYVQGATVEKLVIYGKQIDGYGLVDNFEGVGLQGSAIVIDGCRLKSGTRTLKSGFLGANITSNRYAGTSAGFVATVRNCVVEEGVVIGYTGTYSEIGSIAGRFQGTIENCESYATVKGINQVGGLVGSQDQAMGKCAIYNSRFHGTVEASGSYAGGIVGSGYDDFGEASAPNGGRPTIQGCSSDGTITGASCVGGILGGDQYVAQTWNNVISYVIGNSFTGKVSGNQYVGAIIGYYNSLNRYDNVSDNTYARDCGADKGIGFIKYLDTSCENPGTMEGTVVFNTETTTDNCPYVQWCAWRKAHNRTDDPLGADANKLCRVIRTKGDLNGDGQITNADVAALLAIVTAQAEEELSVADLNGDGFITNADVAQLLQMITAA